MNKKQTLTKAADLADQAASLINGMLPDDDFEINKAWNSLDDAAGTLSALARKMSLPWAR